MKVEKTVPFMHSSGCSDMCSSVGTEYSCALREGATEFKQRKINPNKKDQGPASVDVSLEEQGNLENKMIERGDLEKRSEWLLRAVIFLPRVINPICTW